VSVQDWLIWAYYLSPFSWATDALGVNEFSAGIYSDPDATDPSRTEGEAYLDAFGLRSPKIWQWAAIAYLWGFYIALTAMSTLLLMWAKPTPTMGAKRGLTHRKAAAPAADKSAVAIEIKASGEHEPPQHKKLGGNHRSSARASGAKASFQLAALPFSPATLAWKDLTYTVYVGKDKTPKVLLKGISGFAEPGKLTALMGASGAGKVRKKRHTG
jgi:ABC-type multidrug transport system fused ATPase/permease subunit